MAENFYPENDDTKEYLTDNTEYYKRFLSDKGKDCLLKVDRVEVYEEEDFSELKDAGKSVFKWVSFDKEYSTSGLGIKEYDVRMISYIADGKFKEDSLVFSLYLDGDGMLFSDRLYPESLRMDRADIIAFAFADKKKLAQERGLKTLSEKDIDGLYEELEGEIARKNAVKKGDVFDIYVVDINSGDYDLNELRNDLGSKNLWKDIVPMGKYAGKYMRFEAGDYLRFEVDSVLYDYVKNEKDRYKLLYEMFGIEETFVRSLTNIKKPDWVNESKWIETYLAGNSREQHVKSYYSGEGSEKKLLFEKFKINQGNGKEVFVLSRKKEGQEIENIYFETDFNKKSADLFLKQWDKSREKKLDVENKEIRVNSSGGRRL